MDGDGYNRLVGPVSITSTHVVRRLVVTLGYPGVRERGESGYHGYFGGSDSKESAGGGVARFKRFSHDRFIVRINVNQSGFCKIVLVCVLWIVKPGY